MIYWFILWCLCDLLEAPAVCYVLLIAKAVYSLVAIGIDIGKDD